MLCQNQQQLLKKELTGSELSCFLFSLLTTIELSITAMLTVEDDEFWKGVSPVEFGSLPALQDAVTVVGYPIGGDTISVTSGVVSRIEILSYVHGSTELVGLQVFITFLHNYSFAFSLHGTIIYLPFEISCFL